MKNIYLRKLVLATIGIIVLFAIINLYQIDRQNILPRESTKILNSKIFHFDGPAKFVKIHHYIRTRDNKIMPDYDPGYLNKEIEKIKNSLKYRDSKKIDWVERGPSNAGGRTRGLLVDPDDTTYHTWYAGSVGGGIWKTENAGKDWINLTPDFPNLATSTLVMSAHNTNVIYAGTGEGFDGLMVNGSGIWKSNDKGNTWVVLESTSQNPKFQNVLRLIVNPEDENELLACTVSSPRDQINAEYKSYIMKSLDGGKTWEEKYNTFYSPIQQLVYTPGDFSVIYASANRNGVYKSTDSGETWEKVFDSTSKGIARIELTVSPVKPGTVVLACEAGEKSELYISRDSMKTAQKILLNSTTQANWLGGQGWYDNTIAAHPFDENKVWVGGSGAILEINAGNEVKEIQTITGFENNTTFLKEVNSQVSDKSYGLASELLGQLSLNTETTKDDLINVEIRFGPGTGQKAHLLNLSFASFEITYADYVDVPFEAWDVKNNRQLTLSFVDLDGDGKWTFQDYSDDDNAMPDVVLVNIIDYSENPDTTIQFTNVAYKGEYYFLMGKDPSYNGTEDNFPEGNLKFITGTITGLLADFTPVTDGYGEFNNVSPVGSKSVHVDHHNILLIPVNKNEKSFYVLNANDGGVAFSDDNGKTFTQTGDVFKENYSHTFSGYNVSQFYGVAKMNGGDRFVGGTQDNGSWISPTDPDASVKWATAPSGDGFEAAWNYRDTNLVLESSQYNNIYKSTNGGKNWTNVNLPESQGPFLTRIITSQSDPDLVFVCSNQGLIKSTDFGDNWKIIDMPHQWQFSFFGPPTAISLADANIVWSGAGMSDNSRVVVSKDKGETWTSTANYNNATMGNITGLTTHPTNPNTAYALFSLANGPKILKTTDLGKTWTDISGFETNAEESSNGFPNVATYSLLVMPFDTNRIWVGTEIGLFESTDGGKNWAYADNGLPAVGIWQMQIVNDEIVLATHGRGIWTVKTSELGAKPNAIECLTRNPFDLNIYPNPMIGHSVISFNVPEYQKVTLSLYSLNGQLLKTIVNTNIKGELKINLNRDKLKSGIYLINLNSRSGTITKKLIVQ